MDDREVVSAVRAALADKVGQERFDLWFGASARLDLRDQTMLVGLPNRFTQDWVRSHFRREIEAACAETLGKSIAVEFQIDATLGTTALAARPASGRVAARKSATDGSSSTATEVNAEGTSTALAKLLPEGTTLCAPIPLEIAPNGGPARRAAGLSADMTPCPEPSSKTGFVRRRFATLDDFVVGSSNRLAHASAQMVAEQPGRFSPLVVYGPTGVGKTHLLEGIWNAARKARPGMHALYLSAEQFTTFFLEALHGRGLPSFRRKYRGVELLLVDGLQFFAGKRATLVELLHTTDTLLREGKQVVFAADRPPSALGDLSEELVTRLSAGMVSGIDPPDFQTRLSILRQLAVRRGFNLADDVAEFVATHLSTHCRELSGALNRLEAASRMGGTSITRAIAEEALAELIRHNSRAVRLADIDKAVCQVFELDSESLQTGQRGRHVSQPRMLAMWLARKHTRSALAEIGRHFGRRSHSTVVSAQKAVSSWMASQSMIELCGKPWNVEEAIRRVEERLRTA